ncbi:MAG TPA: 3-deoxy-manno-octulosonate cytidylyltransferase [Bacteroidia bacterium]|jgi:3-deoxy-manno-octulosonate cytidylyltransferase (CMP-KDO synthetase)|nr:3-deoxy-manno-octulosonate cytidylyltransferase [Bacteroidia bacterium]
MILGVIPARYASSRFPGKPLVDILGKSMIQRVYEQAKKSGKLTDVVVATDDERISIHVKSFGGQVVMTEANHPSGTDRCFEALKKLGKDYTYIINIQGDEPFIDPSQIDLLAGVCDGKTELATLMIPVDSHEVLFDTGEVKITMNDKHEALYFSREVIPHIKGVDKKEWHKHFPYYRHVGMYAYRADVLKQITTLAPSSLEKAESLEQLRWLENGFKIKLAITDFDSHCVDTPEDIEKVIRLMKLA